MEGARCGTMMRMSLPATRHPPSSPPHHSSRPTAAHTSTKYTTPIKGGGGRNPIGRVVRMVVYVSFYFQRGIESRPWGVFSHRSGPSRQTTPETPTVTSIVRQLAVESRIRPNGGFGETPGKLLTLKYNLLLPQKGR